MPERKLTFTVQNNSLKAYSLAVYENTMTRKDLEIVNGEGSIILKANVEHSLVWWLTGNPGSSIKVEAQVGDIAVLDPAVESKIPRDESRAYGYRYFEIA